MPTWRRCGGLGAVAAWLLVAHVQTACQHQAAARDEAEIEPLAAANAPMAAASAPTRQPASASGITPASAPARAGKASPRDHAAAQLSSAYEALTLDEAMHDTVARDPRTSSLLPAAQGFYNQAKTAFDRGEYRRAAELAHASHDVAISAQHASRATSATPPTLAKPPAAAAGGKGLGFAQPLIERTATRLARSYAASDADAEPFKAASRELLGEAKSALAAGDEEKAMAYAKAADALSRIEEHLQRATSPEAPIKGGLPDEPGIPEYGEHATH